MLTLSDDSGVESSEDDLAESLLLLSRAGAGVIHIRSSEIVRATLALRAAALLSGSEYHEWNIADGFKTLTIDTMYRTDVAGDGNSDIHAAMGLPLRHETDPSSSAEFMYYVYINPQSWLPNNPVLTHYLQQMDYVLPSGSARTILVTPDAPLPEPYQDLAVSIRFAAPTHAELRSYLDRVIDSVTASGSEGEQSIVHVDNEGLDRLCYAAAGMPKAMFDLHASLAIVKAGSSESAAFVTEDDLRTGLLRGKTAVVARTDGVLELYPQESMENVGGMGRLKTWVRKRAACYSDAARAFGIEPPKGIVYVGLPGCQPAGSRVLMANRQWAAIETVCKGDLVVSPQRDTGVLDMEVAETVIYRDQKIYRIVSSGKRKVSYRCAYNHVMPVYYRGVLYEMQVTEFLRQSPAFQERAMLFTSGSQGGHRQFKRFRVFEDGTEDVYGIRLASGSRWYITDGHIVTRNTGKSLAAKAISSELGVPLVRLDVGRIFNSLVGASEQRVRTALQQVEEMAPCVLFVDEIDKGLGGAGGSGDSGTSSRVLGTLLTWLQDNRKPVFTMVTANNITGLPPELLRRGRFDEIFSTGFPSDAERREVLAIHLRKRGYDMATFSSPSVQAVVAASRGYVPAELESAVKAGLVDAFAADEAFELSYVVEALKGMVPLSVTYSEKIQEMALWMRANATPASDQYDDATAPTQTKPAIDMRAPRRTRVVRNQPPKDNVDD